MSTHSVFALQEVVPEDLMQDERFVRSTLERLHRDLVDAMGRQHAEPLGPVETSMHREEVFSGRPLAQSWWQWLLRRPVRFTPRMWVLRVQVDGVKQEPADAR